MPDWNVWFDAHLVHRGWPRWRYAISVEIDTGIVWSLAITHTDDYPASGGITKTDTLRNLPLEDLVAATRRHAIQFLETWDASQPKRIAVMDTDGNLRTIVDGAEMHPSRDLRTEWKVIAANVRRRAGTRRGRHKEIDDRDIVDALAAYIDWALRRSDTGETKAAFLTRFGISSRTLDNYKDAGEEREFFVRGGTKGRPGGYLTELGLSILEKGN